MRSSDTGAPTGQFITKGSEKANPYLRWSLRGPLSNVTLGRIRHVWPDILFNSVENKNIEKYIS